MPRLAFLAPRLRTLAPGLLVAALVALAAQFLSEHYGAPAMLMALLLGIALAFLSEEGRTAPGIGAAARGVLRIGVALLGARISAGLVLVLGPGFLALVVAGVAATIGFGLVLGRLMRQEARFAFLTAGSVAICGASAAMAIAAILPRDDRSEERLIFTVVGVTVLSTLAMIAYPVAVAALGLETRAAAVFLGATIHDVAQVVGAGFSVSPETGETATLVKLIRVSLLAPVVLLASVALRRGAAPQAAGRPPLLPGFVVGFLLLAAANTAGAIPPWLSEALGATSRWALLVAIAGVGMKTDLRRVLAVGGAAIGLMLAETAFLALFILGGLALLR
jgi:uncharacterized integral membrane protein (TIGR00698 family)